MIVIFSNNIAKPTAIKNSFFFNTITIFLVLHATSLGKILFFELNSTFEIHASGNDIIYCVRSKRAAPAMMTTSGLEVLEKSHSGTGPSSTVPRE